MELYKEPCFNKCGRNISDLLKETFITCKEYKRFIHLKMEGFLSTSQNQGVNKSKHFCRKVKVPASEMEEKAMEAPALQCNKIYCRGQTKAEEFMLSPAQIFLGWKLWCYFFTLSTSWWQKIPCKPSIYQKKPSVPWEERGVSFSLHQQLWWEFCLRSVFQSLPMSQTL